MAEQLKKFDSTDSIRSFVDRLKQDDAWISLQDKTQVFNERVSSTVKTRGSHSSDVGMIARALTAALTTDKVTVARAELMGLLHDLGHIPFGHAGEAVAETIIKDHEFTDEEKAAISQVREVLFGKEYNDGTKKVLKDGTVVEYIGFEHNENSVLRYIMLCKQYGYEVDQDIVLGILAHSTSRYLGVPKKLDQQAVRLADKLAYINYDVSDLLESFKDNPVVLAALEKIYSEKLTVKNPITGEDELAEITYYGDDIVVRDPISGEMRTITNGQLLSMREFALLPAGVKIDMFMNASVFDAKVNDRLTGCNDIVVDIAQLSKAKKNKEKELKKITDEKDPKRAELQAEIDSLQKQITQKYYDLYKRNRTLYAAYILKERSDDFIRAGVNLPKEVQIEKITNAESAVGNKDLEKEFIYKQLSAIIEDNLDLQALENNPNYSPEEKGVIREFVIKFMEYKAMEDETIRSHPNNTTGVTYPVIYSIINFIGTYTNSELNQIAEKLNITKRFEEEVLPQLRALLSDPKFYDEKKGELTGAGYDERNKIVLKYGAIINLHYGMEEESLAPSTAEEVIKLISRIGYAVDTEQTVAEQKKVEELTQGEEKEELSEEEKREVFREAAQRNEQAVIELNRQVVDSMNQGRQM